MQISKNRLKGDGLLIAPVVKPMNTKETVSHREVYLPVGEWLELTTCSLLELTGLYRQYMLHRQFRTEKDENLFLGDSSACEKRHTGGRVIQVQVPLDECPIFRKVQ